MNNEKVYVRFSPFDRLISSLIIASLLGLVSIGISSLIIPGLIPPLETATICVTLLTVAVSSIVLQRILVRSKERDRKFFESVKELNSSIDNLLERISKT